MDRTRLSYLACLCLVWVAEPLMGQIGSHSDVFFTYGEEQIEIAPQNGRLVIPQVLPESGFFSQANSNPGFFSESDIGGGTGAQDIVAYNVLDDLFFWSEGEFRDPQSDTQVRIVNNPGFVADTLVGLGTGEQLASFTPLTNAIGQSGETGEFHAHVDFQLEPRSSDPEERPEFGAYGLKLSLSSNRDQVETSDPFFIVYRFGMDEAQFELALDAFDTLLTTTPPLAGDFNDDGVLTHEDIDMLSAEVRAETHSTRFDLTGDQQVDDLDRVTWVRELAGTFFGDADLDQEVAFPDFIALSTSYSAPGGWASGDFDGNGLVAFADFVTLANRFGSTSGAETAAVPEPSGFVLLTLTAGHVLAIRRRRNRATAKPSPVGPHRAGFTLVELLVVIAIIAMLVALLLPAIQAARAAARKTQCTNNIRQLGLSFQVYHDSKGHFPESEIGSGQPDGHGGCRGGMYSWHARVLPYIEETALHDSISFEANMSDSCTSGQDGTISQLHPNARAAATEVQVFLCPSDGVTGSNHVVMGSANPASDNYAANAGWPTSSTGLHGSREAPLAYNGLVTLRNPAASVEGLAQSPVRIRNVVDGLAKTAAISERLIQFATERDAILTGDQRLQSFHITGGNRSLDQLASRCSATSTHADAQHSAYLGRAWISGWSPTGATYRHLKLPNTNHCHFSNSYTSGEFIVTPTSDHSGGVNVAMADGHVRFVVDGVEPSIWWSMGSRNGQDGGE